MSELTKPQPRMSTDLVGAEALVVAGRAIASGEWSRRVRSSDGIAAGVEDLVAHAGVGAVAGAADDERITPPLARQTSTQSALARGQQPLREAQDEALEVVGLRDLL